MVFGFPETERGHETHLLEELPDRAPYTHEHAEAALLQAGINPETIDPHIVEHMVYMGRKTETIEDEGRVASLADEVFDALEREGSDHALGPKERRLVVAASLLSDLGKAGPLAAQGTDVQRWVTRMYAERGEFSPRRTIAEFIHEFFAGDEAAMLEVLRKIPELSAEAPIRTFWNVHVKYTYDLLKDSGLDPETVLAATAHHWIQGGDCNPGIVNEQTAEYQALGVTRSFGRADAWVVIFDIYEAGITRYGRTHAEQIAKTKAIIFNQPIVKNLPKLTQLFTECIEDLERIDPTHVLQPKEALAAK